MRHRHFTSRCLPLLMRFDGERPTAFLKDVHPSLQPKPLPVDYTPFPLPKYDTAMGFGPTRLQSIPDIAKAKKAMVDEAGQWFEQASDSISSSQRPADPTVDEQENVMSCLSTTSGTPYVQQPGYPLLDRLVCMRSLEDLLHQYSSNTCATRRAAAICDIAHSLDRWSIAELKIMFATLSESFDPDGFGIKFVARRVHGYQLPFEVSSPLHHAFRLLMELLDEHFEGTALQQIHQDPTLLVSMIEFYARTKVFQTDLWHSVSHERKSNMTTGLQSKSHNKHYFNKAYFRSVFSEVEDLLSGDVDNQIGQASTLVSRLSMSDIAELFCALTSIDEKGAVAGAVTDALIAEFLAQLQEQRTVADELQLAKLDQLVGKLAFAASMAGVTNHFLDAAADACSTPSELLLMYFAHRAKKLPCDRVVELVKKNADVTVSLLEKGDVDAAAALVSGARELLMTVDNVETARSLSSNFAVGANSLACVRHVAAVAPMWLNHVSQQMTAPIAKQTRLKTYLTQLDRINRMTAAYIFHSSYIEKDMMPFISALRLVRSGKSCMIVTTQSTLLLEHTATNAADRQHRQRAERALKIIAHEAKNGIVHIVPFEEELMLRDSGLYFDEDVIAWSLIARLVHDAPATKPFFLVSENSTAARPHKHVRNSTSMHLCASKDLLYIKPSLKAGQVGMSKITNTFSSHEISLQTKRPALTKSVRDKAFSTRDFAIRRAMLAFRRDRPLFDKYRVHARNTTPGVGRGNATNVSYAGLGYHTPDHALP